MFDHVTVRASSVDASARFYDTVLATLGIERTGGAAGLVEWGDFGVAEAADGRPVTRRLHVGFVAPSREHVDEFWRVGTAAGHRDDGPPGRRPEYGDDYYGSFLLDPDGNSAEAVHHGDLRRGGNVDHMWIRVGDVSASQALYEAIAPKAGLRLRRVDEGRVQIVRDTASFSLVAGEPTVGLHMALGMPDRASVDAFHAAGVAAGWRDDGAPGERPAYHPGYYAAYLLDRDGLSVEAVHHGERG